MQVQGDAQDGAVLHPFVAVLDGDRLVDLAEQADVIAQVAEQNYGWKPAHKYKADKFADEELSPDQVREDLERAFRVIAGTGYGGYELAQLYDIDELDSFHDAWQVMSDMREA